ncbi:polysaccharide deacetylase family protein [Cohnella suwonensis]|uniref:Polysaccharide deacetylase family protein n=1 Tax=Cohnella suwonensis TaxID=696072 RepID=A0ABW0M435_9BACL
MRKKMPAGFLAGLALIGCAVWLAGSYGPLRSYVQDVKQGGAADAAVIAVANAEPESDDARLLAYIQSEADKRMQQPVDAVIDRVWKAIPGYDGRTVDVQATYGKAKSLRASPGDKGFPWIYKAIKPKVSLKDLPVQPIYKGNAGKPSVALMINVAWGDEYLAPMLDILKEAGVKATFFFDGTWLSKHMDTAKAIIAQGHEVSNHAYTHPDMSKLGAARQREEIGRTEELLKKLGVRNEWFAPPSGYYNANTVKVASEFGLRTVLWTLDTIDWMKPDPSAVVEKVSRKVGPGSLILMHPTSTSRGALAGMIKAIRAKGLTPGTVSETLSSERTDVRL